ncbi:pentapeptide repeat-containing protein [Candidatus Woesearchaeota archaeon]|nr:pentapeptide repeat-containing protein [Candidatus Woesearchaeota archaeon]
MPKERIPMTPEEFCRKLAGHEWDLRRVRVEGPADLTQYGPFKEFLEFYSQLSYGGNYPFEGNYLCQVFLDGSEFSNLDAGGLYLPFAEANGTYWKNVKFENAFFLGAKFRGATFEDCNPNGSCLFLTDFNGATFIRGTFNNIIFVPGTPITAGLSFVGPGRMINTTFTSIDGLLSNHDGHHLENALSPSGPYGPRDDDIEHFT